MSQTLEALLALPWWPIIDDDPEGGLVLRVPPVHDFELFGDDEESLTREWRGAFESHLRGYLAVGKTVPVPGTARVGEPVNSAGEPNIASHELHVVDTPPRFEVVC